MPITIEFQKPAGIIHPTREFEPGDEIRIIGKISSSIGLWQPFIPVQLEIVDDFSPIFLDTRTGPTGNYWFDIQLPYVVTVARVIITTWFLNAVEQKEVKIGIGEIPPDMPTPPEIPLWENLPLLIVLGIGGIVLLKGMEYLPAPRRNPRRKYLR